MKVMAGETLGMLVSEYKGLVKYNREGLRKAYGFGQLVRALHKYGFSYAVMAETLDVSDQTVSRYARLAGRYATEKALLDASDRLGSVDVGLLASAGTGSGQFHLELHCTNCDNTEFRKVRVPGPREQEPVPA